MKKLVFILPGLLLAAVAANAQSQNVGIGTISPDASAQLDVSSTTKGLLPPRMTTAQRNAIVNPAAGLVIYNTTTGSLEVNTGTMASPVWTASKAGSTPATTLTSSSTPAGSSVGQTAYNTGNVQPTGLVYWDGSQWQSVASSGGNTTNNYTVVNNDSVINNNPVINNDTTINNGPVYNTSNVTNGGSVTNNSTSTFNGTSTFNKKAVFSDSVVMNGTIQVGGRPLGLTTDSVLVFEPTTKVMRRLAVSQIAGSTQNVTLTGSNSPAGTSPGQVVYNAGSVQPTGLVYWDGSQWKSVASSGGTTVNNYTVTNNDSVINNNVVTNNDTAINNGPVYNNSTSTFNNTSTFNKKAVFNDTAVFSGGMKVSNLPQGLPTDSVLVFEPSTKVMRRISVGNVAAAGEPWYKAGTTAGATSNTDDVYIKGNVGVRNSTPVATLDIMGDVHLGGDRTNGVMKMTGYGGRTYIESGLAPTSGSKAPLYFTDFHAANTWMTIDTTGKVGIGTSTPVTKLDVSGNISSSNSATNSGTNNLSFRTSAGTTRWTFGMADAETGSGNTGANYLIARYADDGSWIAHAMSINRATGNVGIGTSTPISKLHIAGDGSTNWNNCAALLDNTGTGGHKWGVGSRYLGTPGDFGISDETDGVVRMTIQGGTGNVGIGTSFPVNKLDVNNGAVSVRNDYSSWGVGFYQMMTPSGSNRWAIGVDGPETGSNAGGNFSIWNYDDNGTNIAIPMTINRATGYVGVGTTAPKAPLHIGGTTASTFTPGTYTWFNHTYATGQGVTSFSGSGVRNDASLISDGNVWVKGVIYSTASMTYSDRRIKNIIGQSDARKDLDLLNQIRITDYRMKDVVMQGNKQYKKVIAQEVESVYPQAVTTQTGYVPNIYQLADKVESLGNSTYKVSFKNKVEYNQNVTGDLKLYDEQKEITAKVVSREGNTIVFSTEDKINGDKLFLYGEEVTDFKAVDYEALSMLNISATQELYREIQDLKKKNAALSASIEDTKKLETAYAQLAAQVKEMQQLIGMKPVAAKGSSVGMK